MFAGGLGQTCSHLREPQCASHREQICGEPIDAAQKRDYTRVYLAGDTRGAYDPMAFVRILGPEHVGYTLSSLPWGLLVP